MVHDPPSAASCGAPADEGKTFREKPDHAPIALVHVAVLPPCRHGRPLFRDVFVAARSGSFSIVVAQTAED
jgi:hypothetical protein